MEERIVYRPRLIWSIGVVGFIAIVPIGIPIVWATGTLLVRSVGEGVAVIVLEIVFLAVLVAALRVFVFSRFILGPEFVELRGAFRTVRLRRSDALGFSEGEAVGFAGQETKTPPAYLIYFRDRKDPISVGAIFDLDDRFFQWMRSLPDLNKVAMEQSEKEVRESFGPNATSEAFGKGMAWRGWVGKGLFAVSVVAAIGTAFAEFLMFSVLVLMLIPLLALAIAGLDRGRFRLGWMKADARISLGMAVTVSGIGMVRLMSLDYETLHPWLLALWSLGIGITLTVIAIKVDKGLRAKPPQAYAVGVILIVGSMVAGVTSNVVFDRSSPRCVDVKVVSKRVDNQSGATYVTLQFANKSIPPAETRSSVPVYESIQAGGPAHLLVRSGFWGYAWVRLGAEACGLRSSG